MDFIQIAKTNIDWNAYMLFCKQHTNNAPIKNLDTSKTRFNEDLAFIASLSELSEKTTSPINAIRGNDVYKQYISICYLFFECELYNYGSLRRLDLTTQFTLVTGSIWEWKETIILNLTEESTRKQKEIYGKLLLDFETKGYSLIFDTHRKILCRDGLIILEEK
jgi:hypothetical protein